MTPTQTDPLRAALEPFAFRNLGSLDSVGGGTRLAPSVTVQQIKDAREALDGAESAAPQLLPLAVIQSGFEEWSKTLDRPLDLSRLRGPTQEYRHSFTQELFATWGVAAEWAIKTATLTPVPAQTATAYVPLEESDTIRNGDCSCPFGVMLPAKKEHVGCQYRRGTYTPVFRPVTIPTSPTYPERPEGWVNAMDNAGTPPDNPGADERAKFEEWWKGSGWGPNTLWGNDAAWYAWQAARASGLSRVVEQLKRTHPHTSLYTLEDVCRAFNINLTESK